jgi:ATP-dependent Lon protease
VILPADNRQDVEEDLTPEMMEGVTVHYARTIDDVLDVALPQFNSRAVSMAAATEQPATAAA